MDSQAFTSEAGVLKTSKCYPILMFYIVRIFTQKKMNGIRDMFLIGVKYNVGTKLIRFSIGTFCNTTYMYVLVVSILYI